VTLLEVTIDPLSVVAPLSSFSASNCASLYFLFYFIYLFIYLFYENESEKIKKKN